MSYSAFQKVWDGRTWQGVHDDVYTEENIALHKAQKANPGSKNGNAILTEVEVLEARMYYVNHTLQETYEKYGSQHSKEGFRGLLTRTYSHIPMYHKRKKQWTLNNEIIQNIDNYKPVSTILGSEE